MTTEGAPVAPAVDELAAVASRGGRWVAVSALGSNLTAALVLVVLAAALEPRDLGVLALGQTAFLVAANLQDLGLFDGLVHRKDRVREAAEVAALVWLVVGGSAGAVVVLLSGELAAFFGEPRAGGVLAVFGVLVALNSAALVPLALLTRSLRLRLRSQLQLGAVVVGGGTTVLLVALGVGIASMLVGQVVQAVLLVGLAWGLGPRVVPRWHSGVLREMLRYGRGSLGASAFTVAQQNVDYVVVGRVLGAAALGLYAFAFRLAFLPYTVVTRVVTGTMFALVCRLDDAADQGQAVVRYTRSALLLVVPMAAGLALLAPALVLLGPQWEAAVPAARLLAGYVVLASLASVAEWALKALGRPGRAALAAGSHLLVLTGLLVLLAGQGLAAVGGVRLVAAAAAVGVGWVFVVRAVGTGWGQLLGVLALPAAGAGAMALVALVSGAATTTSPGWAGTATAGLAVLVAYGSVVVVGDRALRSQASTLLRRGAPG